MTSLIKKIRNATVGLIIGAGLATIPYSYFASDSVRTKITDAQMVKVDGRFMIATEYRPFQNHDAWYRGKFSSGDFQNDAIRLKGKEVEITKYGWRNPLFSMYENVVDIREVR